MIPITPEQLFAAYPDHPAITDEHRANAVVICDKMNTFLAAAEADGVVLEVNQHEGAPHYGTHISGQKDGGWRPPECPTGAAHSKHKEGRAIDACDHAGHLDKWADDHPDEMKAMGIGREHPDATVGWCHGQDGPSAAGHWVFHP